MASNTSNTRTKEQFWKLYEKLPQELRDAVFSNETAEQIQDIGSRYGIGEEKISDVAVLVGDVLMGLSMPEYFEKKIKKDLKLTADAAKNISHEINRFIFYPVKESLSSLHKVETALNGINIAAMPVKPAAKPEEEKTPSPSDSIELKPDTYRETIE